jgi:hypothetical protein
MIGKIRDKGEWELFLPRLEDFIIPSSPGVNSEKKILTIFIRKRYFMLSLKRGILRMGYLFL